MCFSSSFLTARAFKSNAFLCFCFLLVCFVVSCNFHSFLSFSVHFHLMLRFTITTPKCHVFLVLLLDTFVKFRWIRFISHFYISISSFFFSQTKFIFVLSVILRASSRFEPFLFWSSKQRSNTL